MMVASIRDPDAILVSKESVAEGGDAIVRSNVAVVNGLLDELLRLDEIASDALRSYYVHYFYAQVMNGGFAQFVYNSRWKTEPVTAVREGLDAMGATSQLEAFFRGALLVEKMDRRLERYLEQDLFGDNATRDAFNRAVSVEVAEGLDLLNGRWLVAHPRLVAVTQEELAEEIRRRGAAVPDREARLARARASEPRPLRLQRALAERAGHQYDRATGVRRVSLGGTAHWGYCFLTDRGPYMALDLGTRALMFPFAQGDLDAATVVVEVACEPA